MTGAGELMAALERRLDIFARATEKHLYHKDVLELVHSIKPIVDELAALAAKAPQGVSPVEAEAVSSTKGNNLVGFNVKVLGVDFGFHGSETPLGRVLAASKLPVPGPVSDDTIHHGMVPPVPPGTPHSSEVPCMTCGRPKPVIYSVNVQTCPGCFQPFDTREAAAQHRGEGFRGN